MDIGTITSLIGQVGFPIVCVLALAWFIYQYINRIETKNVDREEKLYTFLGRAQEQLDEAQKTNAGFVEILKSYRTDLDEIKTDIEIIKEKI